LFLLPYLLNSGGNGTWVLRLYVGRRNYKVEKIAAPDDFSDTNAIDILNFKQAQDEAPGSSRFGFHQLRHTWASLAIMAGVPLLVVARNLGHTDTRKVERHYGHLAPSYIDGSIQKGAPKFGFKTDVKVRHKT
jgi:integrase